MLRNSVEGSLAVVHCCLSKEVLRCPWFEIGNYLRDAFGESHAELNPTMYQVGHVVVATARNYPAIQLVHAGQTTWYLVMFDTLFSAKNSQ